MMPDFLSILTLAASIFAAALFGYLAGYREARRRHGPGDDGASSSHDPPIYVFPRRRNRS